MTTAAAAQSVRAALRGGCLSSKDSKPSADHPSCRSCRNHQYQFYFTGLAAGEGINLTGRGELGCAEIGCSLDSAFMDTFVSKFFSGFVPPGVPFKQNAYHSCWTYFRAALTTKVGGATYAKVHTSYQRMAPLGLMECVIAGEVSMVEKLLVDGVGNVDLNALTEAVTSGLNATVWVAHHGEMLRWKWVDNQMAQWANLIWFALLRRFTESLASNLNARFSGNTGEVMSIDQNWFFTNA